MKNKQDIYSYIRNVQKLRSIIITIFTKFKYFYTTSINE